SQPPLASPAPARPRPSRRARRGNGVIEAALVLPVLLSLSMGMIEFGQFFYCKHTLQAASRDAARTAILSSTTHAAATAAATNTLSAANISSGKYTIAFTNASTNATISDVSTVSKGTGIKVTISSTAGQISVRPLGVIASSKAITGVTTMIKE
ncbi:MAG TPA: TadE family protein, partial [Humisphaera sp.]